MTEIGEGVGFGLILGKPDQTGSLTVKVVDDCRQEGVEGAVVSVAGEEKKTPASGSVTFSDLPLGDHGVNVLLHQKDCDYVEFGVQPGGGIDSDTYGAAQHPFEFAREAISTGKGVASVKAGSTNLEIEMPVHRHMEEIKVKRRNTAISPVPGDDGDHVEMGHWWVEIQGRSWGWYPKPMIEAEDLPPELSDAEETIETLEEVLLDDSGMLNLGMGSRDPKHGEAAEREYTVVLHDDCRELNEIVSDVRSFVTEWMTENHSRYSISRGLHCQNFQIALLRACGLDRLRPAGK